MPINAGAFATIPPELRTDGSSLDHLSRSVGASIGISLVTTMLARGLQTSHADIGSHVTGSVTRLIDFSTIDRYQVTRQKPRSAWPMPRSTARRR